MSHVCDFFFFIKIIPYKDDCMDNNPKTGNESNFIKYKAIDIEYNDWFYHDRN